MTAAVTGFVRTKPEHLHAFPATSDTTGGPWPSRRVWAMLAAALAHVRDDDHASRQAVVFGLIGEGVGVEFLTWCEQADLPDRVWAVLSGVVAWATAQRTAAAWRSAWGPLLAAAEHGAPDVAAAARPLGRAHPATATVPAAVRTHFAPVLAAAGLSQVGAA